MPVRSFRFPAGTDHPAVDVRNPAGSVDADAVDAAAEFTVEVEPLDDGAEELLDRVEVEVVGSRLRVVVPERRFLRSPSFAVRVTAPAGSDARVAVASADTVLRGSWGELALTTASGDATVESCAQLQLRTASGDARIGSVADAATLGGASGDLRVDSAGGALEARTASGDVSVGLTGRDARITTASGDVVVDRASSGCVQVKTVSGDVTIGVVPDLRVWLDLSSVSGRMESELTADDDGAAGGPASVRLSVRTVSGNLRIRPVPVAV